VDGAGNVDPANSSAATLRYGTAPSAPPAPAQNEPTLAPLPASTQPTPPLVDVTTTLTAPAPTTATFRRDVGLRLTSARFSHGRLVIHGRLGAPARVVFTVRTMSRHLVRRTIAINKRRFAVSIRIRHPRGRVIARFAGDGSFRPAGASLRPTR
jgi:hypothetical protein